MKILNAAFICKCSINKVSGLLAMSGGPGLDQGPAHDDLRQVNYQTEQKEHTPKHGEGLAKHSVGGLGRA